MPSPGSYVTTTLVMALAVMLAPSAFCAPVDFTYIDCEGVGINGSTAFRVDDGNVVLYIHAFADNQGSWDPETVTDADIIIQEYHGHVSHYDPNITATVANQSGAYVVGNHQVIVDMTNRGVDPAKLVELSPAMGGQVSTTVLGIDITAFGMRHTYYESTLLTTFAFEMPDGFRWYHGGGSSHSSVASYMLGNDAFYGLEVMMLDFEHNFAAVNNEFDPDVFFEVHQYSSPNATMWTDYPAGASTVTHLMTVAIGFEVACCQAGNAGCGTTNVVAECDGWLSGECCGDVNRNEVDDGCEAIALSVGPTELSWAELGPATGYDIVQGDLGLLRANGGDFSLAVEQCVESEYPGTTLPYTAEPDSGEAQWYLVRSIVLAKKTTYASVDDCDLGVRDAQIDAADAACP